MFSNIHQPALTNSKLEVFYVFDVRFHTEVHKSSLSSSTDCTKHASAATLIHLQQTIIVLGFTQTKLSSIYRHKPFVTNWVIITDPHEILLFSVCIKSTIVVFKVTKQLSEENGGGPFC